MTDGVQTSLKFSRFFTPKDNLTRNDSDETRTKSWKEWVGEKLRLGRKTGDGKHPLVEKITLFPGWATKRYDDENEESFGIDVFVSGYASRPRTPERISRRQRVFIRLAKSFVSLPKLAADSASETSTSLRTSVSNDSLPVDKNFSSGLTEECAIKTLEREFQRASAIDDNGDESCDLSSAFVDNHAEPHPQGSGIIGKSSSKLDTTEPADILRRQHANLEQRLQHFWAQALPTRTVRLHLFASPHHSSSPSAPSPKKQHPQSLAHDPVDFQDVVTAADGSFQTLFRLSWTDLCQHPGTGHIASGDGSKEHDLFLSAQLLPSSASTASSPSFESTPPASIRSCYSRRERVPKQSLSPPIPSTILIPLTHSPIRVISDIDDTVKLSDILLGPRAMFRNLFIKELHENVIPSMSEWYAKMWARGVRFHYVSNSPFEIFPIIHEFLHISRLPPGSIKLKSYTGGSLFNEVITAHGTRKRPGVVEILSAFPNSRFFLIGDSGQQDLELYADLAQERPSQILAVLIRYADDTCEPIDDTTGEKWLSVAGTRTNPLLSSGSANADDRPRTTRKLSDMLSRSSSSSSPKSLSPMSSSPLNIPPRSAKREDVTGVADDFSPTRFTTEPESDTPPSPPLLTSSTPPKTNPSSSYKNRSVSIPSLRISPSAGFSARKMSLPSTAPRLASRSSTSSSIFRISSDMNKKRDLQKRVYRARTRIPGHIPLRVFRDPSECVEVEEELRRVGL